MREIRFNAFLSLGDSKVKLEHVTVHGLTEMIGVHLESAIEDLESAGWSTDEDYHFINQKTGDKIDFETAKVNDNGEDYWFIEKCDIVQFTGLKDKNGKDIFEGDIIKWKFVNTGELDESVDYIEVVEWNECGFFLDGGAPLTVAMDDCEILGNVYQNPELFNHQ